MADHHDLAAVLAHPRDFDMDFGDERARRVEHRETARLGLRAHRFGDAVRGEHDGAAARDLVQLLDEHRAFRLQVVDDEAVVDDLVAHVDRRAELRERLLDDRDRAVDAGAEAARIGEQHVHQLPRPDGTRGADRRRAAGGSCRGSAARRRREIALSATLNAGHDQRS